MTSTLTPHRAPPVSVLGSAGALGLVASGGVVLGAGTAFAQAVLPRAASPLANSAGSWVLAAFLLALSCRRLSAAAAGGALALAALTCGYYVTNELRGYPASTAHVLFWLVASVAVGPFLGAAAHVLRTAAPRLAALGAGGLAGLLIGEGVYGLRFLDGDTAAYWWVQIAVATVVWATALRHLRVRGRLPAADANLALAVVVTLAVAFPVIYSRI